MNKNINYNDIGIFIVSCDATSDILHHFLLAYKKFNLFKSSVFIGSNGNKVYKKLNYSKPIISKKSNWRTETLDQIIQIKRKYKKKKLILFLDDFILESVDKNRLYDAIDFSLKKNIKYLTLREQKFSFFEKFFFGFQNKSEFLKISKNYPYYSSLQVSIWDIDYLIQCLKKQISIWEFERLKSKYKHYAVKNTVIKYKHIVEKGEWIFYAKNYCKKNCNKFREGNRKTNLSFNFIINFYVSKLMIKLFGSLVLK